MIAALDEGGKGVISKDGFKKFMTARMVSMMIMKDYRDEPE